MTFQVEKDEGTAARRRVPFRLFASDGTSPDTGASNDTVMLSINGAAQIVSDGSVSAISAAAGMYYNELSQSNVSVLGSIAVWYDLGDFDQHVATVQVVNSNPMSTQSSGARTTLVGVSSEGSITGLVLTGGSGTTAFYDGQLVTITGGTGVGQSRTVLDYRGDNNLATVTREFATAPDATSVFVVSGADIPAILEAGNAQGGAAGSITLDAQASAINNTYVDEWVMITAGTGIGQTRVIGAYNGTTKVATISPNWTTAPDGTSVYQVLPAGRVDVAAWAGNAVTASSGNPDVNIESIDAGAIVAASFGAASIDAAALASDAVNEIADGVLDRNMATGADSGTSAVRTPRDALRALRNRVVSDATQLYIYQEDDTTIQWTASLSTVESTNNHISGMDPNS
jgi:hypothetical protein